MTNITPRLDPGCFSSPFNDNRYLALPDDLRDVVDQRLSAMQIIATAKKIARGIQTVLQSHPGKKSWTARTLRNLWYAFWNSGGDWTTLLNKRSAGGKWWKTIDERGLPDAFITHLGEIYSDNQRDKFAPAWDALVQQYKRWRGGDASAIIKGYSHCPKPRQGDALPAGWSYENLLRIAQRAAKINSRKTIQIGPKAAAQYKLPIFKTREGAEVGQYPIIDDSWNDFKPLFRGQAVRLLSLHMLDYASGCNVIRGYKPAVEDEHGVQERLKEREVVYLVAAYFAYEGYRPAGTKLICEKSTATIRHRERDFLERNFKGVIEVDDGPAGGGPGIAGLFTGPGGGNPDWKAPIESWFNLLRNRSASLLQFPGQTGSNARLNAPEGMFKIAAADEAMTRAMQLLPPEKAELIKFNLLSYWEAVPALEAVTEAINCRTNHNLQGWRKCGHYIPVFRLAEHLPWMPAALLTQLPEAEREQIRLNLLANPKLSGEQPLSPRHVYNAGRAKLKRFTPAQTALFLTGVEGEERPVTNGLLEVNCAEVDPDEPLRFGPVIRDCDGREEVLRHEDKYLVRVNPLRPETAFLYHADGGFAGLASSYGRVAPHDCEALQEKFKVKAKAVSAWTKDARKLAAPITARAAAIATNNEEVIFGDQREKDRTLNRLAKKYQSGDQSAADTFLSAIAERSETQT